MNYSVNRDFPSEISRARKLLWPKLKQTRQLNPMAKVSMGYPAKIIMNGNVTEDLFPEWDTILRGSRIDAEHPSQLNLNRGRANTNQSGSVVPVQEDQLSQSLLPQQPQMQPGTPQPPNNGSSGISRSTTIDFNVRDPVDTTPAKVTGTESPMEQGNGAFVRPVQSAPTGSKERKSRSKTRNSAKKTSDSPRSVSARFKSRTSRASQSVSRSASCVRQGAQSLDRNEAGVNDAGDSQLNQPSDTNVD